MGKIRCVFVRNVSRYWVKFELPRWQTEIADIRARQTSFIFMCMELKILSQPVTFHRGRMKAKEEEMMKMTMMVSLYPTGIYQMTRGWTRRWKRSLNWTQGLLTRYYYFQRAAADLQVFTQGSHGPWKSWTVLEFGKKIQALKVFENWTRSLKILELPVTAADSCWAL